MNLLEHTPSSDPPADRLAPLRNRERFADRKPRSDVQSGRRKENPVEFLDRVYHDRRDYDLRRMDLAELDPGLYHSLSQWLNRNNKALSEDFGLPSITQLTDQNIALFGVGKDSPRLTKALPSARAVVRAYTAARSRKSRRKDLQS